MTRVSPRQRRPLRAPRSDWEGYPPAPATPTGRRPTDPVRPDPERTRHVPGLEREGRSEQKHDRNRREAQLVRHRVSSYLGDFGTAAAADDTWARLEINSGREPTAAAASAF